MYKNTAIARVALTAVFVIGTISCDPFEEIVPKNYITVETEYYDMDFEIQPMDKSGFQIFTEEFFESDLTALLEKAGFNPDMIEEIKIKEGIVNLRDTQVHKNFNNIKFIEVTVYTDSLGERKIASLDPVPADRISVEMDLANIDVSDYFEEDRFMVSVQGFLKDRISTEMKLHASVKFSVKIRMN